MDNFNNFNGVNSDLEKMLESMDFKIPNALDKDIMKNL